MNKKRKSKTRKGQDSSVQSGVETPPDASKSNEPTSETGDKRRTLQITFVALVVAVILLYFSFKPLSTSQLIDQVHKDFQSQQHGLVMDGVQQLIERDAADADLLVLGGQSAFALNHYDRAIEFFNEIDDNHDSASIEARLKSGEIHFDRGQAVDSEKELRRALAIEPKNPRASSRLSILLNILGRRYESTSPAFESLKAGMTDFDQLVLLADRNPSADFGNIVNVFLKNANGDPRAKLSETRKLVIRENTADAIPILKEILAADPKNIEASVFLGRCYWATANENKFSKWFHTASIRLKIHPDFWNIAGDWAYAHDQPKAAARYYWEALQRDPDIRNANARLADLLQDSIVDLDQIDPVDAKRLADELESRAVQVRTIEMSLVEIMSYSGALSLAENEDEFRTVVSSLKKLGRNWEAYAWSVELAKLFPTFRWAIDQAEELKTKLNNSVPRYAATDLPASRVDLSDLPEIQFDIDSRTGTSSQDRSSTIAFDDVTAAAGIDFTFFNATRDGNILLYMYQLMGASAGVVDFNLDGLPDIYFPQGCEWPIDPEQVKYFDQLFVNRGDGTFSNATENARLKQNGFGQSVTVADYDCDGFPDLHIVNIDGARLLRNNGDGSYSDATPLAMRNVPDWTVACAMVDLNGDQLPDICDVSYADGDNVFTKTCKSGKLAVSCPPKDFEQTLDRFWINEGDGNFSDVTEALKLPPGKGLGIVAADFNHDDRMDLFVSNDSEANFLFVNESNDHKLAFAEMATEMGVDLDNAGEPQGCMGIAVLDVNRDQKLDYFVTNFYLEYNTLYLSGEFGFVDASRKANLSAPGYKLVGFGTQALDADLDGDDDIMITNGHVEELRDPEYPTAMPTLFLENTGSQRFVQRSADEVGAFFGEPLIGRGMARLDWNRDGRPEVVIGNMTRPAKLLRNESQSTGRFLSIRLIGVESSRDAIGSRVVVTTEKDVQYKQLTAGDGYGSSNQRELMFGTGDANAATLTIHWPSGFEQDFKNVSTNAHYIAVEGRDELFPTN